MRFPEKDANVPKTDHQRIIEHFSLMNVLAKAWAAFPVLLVEHSFDHVHRGSWFVILKKFDKKFQATWDGAEGLLSFLEGTLAADGKRVVDWVVVSERRYESGKLPTARDILDITGSLAGRN